MNWLQKPDPYEAPLKNTNLVPNLTPRTCPAQKLSKPIYFY